MKTMSLRFRLVFGGILLAVIPILAVGFFSDMRSSAALNRVSGEHVVNISKDLAAIIRIFLADQERAVRQISVSGTLSAAMAAAAEGRERNGTEISALDAELAKIMGARGRCFSGTFCQ
ncbi:MAG: hypothetical protein R2941_04985 [Desulfobacterales bacterium]